MAHNEKTYPLTIFLIKKNKCNSSNLVDKNIKSVQINNVGDFYYEDSQNGKPKWYNLFNDYNLPLFSSNASGLLLIEIRERKFAIAFGPKGRHYLNKGTIEERFGLITTLNSVEEGSMRSIDTKTLESEGIQTRIQSAMPVSAEVFGLDVEKDLLRSVVGKTEDKRLGNILVGRDSLRLSVKCNLNNLKDILDIVLENYQKKDYQKKFPWVDNLKEIGDIDKIKELNEVLIQEINKEKPEKLWLTIPEIMDWEDHGGFKFSSRKSDDLLDDIYINTFKEKFNRKIELKDITTYAIYRFLQSNEFSNDHWRVYDCIYFEHSNSNETYFLTGGKWYSVNNNLVKSVNDYYDNYCPNDAWGIIFPDYNHKNENKYNKALAKKNSALCLDGKFIQIEGKNRFEFCDVYKKEKIIIHIKRYANSSALSHLFNQGLVSANFLMDEIFRTKINNELLTGDFIIKDTQKRPNSDASCEYKILFGIISKVKGTLNLPFFSKLTLMHVAKALTNLGFNFSLVKISNIKPNKEDN